LAIVERRFRHKLDIHGSYVKPAKIPSVKNWGMDHEIKTSLKNLANAEKSVGVRFTPEFVQTYMELSIGDL